MPRRRRDTKSDENSSSSSSDEDSSDSSVSKRPDHKRSRTDHKLKSSPSRIVRYSKDHRHHREDSGGRKQTFTSRHKSSDSYRRQSPAQESRRVDDRGDSRRRERDNRHGHSERRNRDTDYRQARDDRDRKEYRQRSRDRETEKNKKSDYAKSSSYSKDRGSSSKGTKETEVYSSKKADSGRKDKTVDISTRKERSGDEKTQKSSSKNSNEKGESKSQQSADVVADDRSRKDEIRVVSETKLKHSEKDTLKEKKRKASTSSSSSSSSDEAHDKSTSDSDSDSDDSNKNYKRVKASKESMNVLIQQKEMDKPVEQPQDSEERVVSIAEDTDNIQKDTAERRRRSSDNNDACSDTSEDESKKPKLDDSHETEGAKDEILQHQQTEDESKVTVEKQQNDDQEKHIISESRYGESNEEKEEGELSEDNEDKPPDMPLKVISEYVSDISSDETTDSKKDQRPKTASSGVQGTPPTSQDPPQSVVENEQAIEPFHKSSRTGRPDKRTVNALNREAADLDNLIQTVKSLDADVVEGEDNSKRLRPLLESESSDDDNASDKDCAVRSQVHGKQRMGSSVSVVKQHSGRKRNRSADRHESEGEGKKEDESRRKDDGWKRDKDDRGRGRPDNRAREKEDDRGKGRDDSRRREKDDSLVRRKDDIRGRDKESEHSRGKGDTRGKPREDNQEKERTDDRKKEKSSSVTNSTQDNQQDKNEKETSVKSTKADSSNPAPTTEEPGKKTVTAFDITTRTGGAYIPPAKLRMMQELITDKTSVAYQRMSWEALKKSINGLINKVNISNIINIIKELFQENIVRGRGLLARSVIQAQAASPTFTHVYAALVAIINTKFPQNGELILRRLILMFRRGYKRNDKALCLSSTMFIAHLVNQLVAHEVLALEILTLLLENPTDDSVEVAIGFLKECGQKLTEVSPRGINSIFERLRNILHEGQLDVRVQYMVEVMFAIRKDGFKDHPAVLTDLDLVEDEEQFTHLLQLEDGVTGDELLNVFKEDPAFAENEEKYKALKKVILAEGSSDESGESSGSESSDSESEDEEKANAEKQTIIDKTETNLVALRRTIYLTVQSSLDHNECAHKMLKMDLQPGQEVELCNMILDCCAQLRTYEKFFGLLAQRFCQLDRKYIEPFQQIFMEQYETIHRLETNKVRNVAKFFAHLLHTDAVSWGVLSVVKLTEEDTSSASRIFLKILFQELSEYMGLLKLNERLKDVTLSPFFSGFMAKDNPKNTRFCINFFTTIGLGGLTDDLREHLKTATKHIVEAPEPAAETDEGSSSSSDSSSDQSDSDSSSDSESDSPSKKKRKSSDVRPKKKAGTKETRSKKHAADKENKKANKHKRKSSEREDNSESKSKSSSRGGKQMSEKNSSPDRNKRNIADRLLDMAEYGNIQNGGERSKVRNDGDRLNRDREVRIPGNKRDEDRDKRKERGEQGYDVRNQESSERWVQSGKSWNNSSERGVGRRVDSVGSGRRNENREQRVHDNNDNRRRDRPGEMTSRRRNDDGSRHQEDHASERRIVSRSGSNKRLQNEHDRENTNKDQVSGESRRVFPKSKKEKRHDSSSSDSSSDSSDEKVKKQSSRDRSVSSPSPEKRGSKRSLETNAVHKQGGNKRPHKYDSSDSSSDSSDGGHSKSSNSKKVTVRSGKR